MTKRAKKRQPTQTPPEWVDEFTEHDHELTRVRMLWRRGGGRYRPLVPVNLALEDLELLDFDEWEDLELPETHYSWSVPTSESPDERQRRLAESARELWAVAVLWTRAKGPVCDFQLRGYGGADEILFEDGKRCNLSGEQSRYDDNERERPAVDETIRAMISDERAAWLQMDRTKDGIINRLTDDREKLFAHLDRTTRAAPDLIENARDVLERAINFQQRHFEEYMSRASGRRELEARAFEEYQKTKRADAALNLVRDAGKAAVAILPTVQDFVATLTGKAPQVMPSFKCAQQALAYLHLTLSHEQIKQCCHGANDAEKSEAAREVVSLLDKLSRMKNEQAMLRQGAPLITSLLNAEKFREVADSEQVWSAKYVLGRAAMFRMVIEDDEVKARG